MTCIIQHAGYMYIIWNIYKKLNNIMSYIDCGLTPYWHSIYEQFILPAFAVTAREEQYPSKHWIESLLLPGDMYYEYNGLCALHDLVTEQQYEPKSPWENPTLRPFGDIMEADPYKSIKTMTRTKENDENNEKFIPLTKNIQENTNTVARFLDQLLSKKSIPVNDISALLAGWSKY